MVYILLSPLVRATFLVTFLSIGAAVAVPIDQQRTFGHSIKNGPLPANTEVTAFEHECSIPPCVITMIHVPAIYPPKGEAWNWTNGILNLYIDDDYDDKASSSNNIYDEFEDRSSSEPSISISLLELAGESRFNLPTGLDGSMSDGGPWGIDMMGRTAHTGGVSSTVRIPFQRCIKITIQAAAVAKGQSVYWMIVRGLEGHRVILGGELELPKSARLRVSKIAPTLLEEYDFVELASSPPNVSGALLRLTLDGVGSNFMYLEGCMRLTSYETKEESSSSALQDNPTIYLSSGVEDFFLSASYFDAGMFKTPNSGLTFLNKTDFTMGAYKTHTFDPILFRDGFRLVFRNMEKTNDCGGFDCCPRHFPHTSQSTASTKPRYDPIQLEKDVHRRTTEMTPSSEQWENSMKGKDESNDGGPATFSALVWYYEWEDSSSDRKNDVHNNNRVATAISRVVKMGASDLISADQEDAVIDKLLLDNDAKLLSLLEGIPSEEAYDAHLARHLQRYLERSMAGTEM